MHDDELRRTLARADRPRAMSSEEEADVLDRILGPLDVDLASTNERAGVPASSSRSTFWAVAAAVIAVVVVGAALLSRSPTEQVAVSPTSTTASSTTSSTTAHDEAAPQPVCVVVGSGLADAVDEWGSIDDWAVTGMAPEPDLAQLALDALLDARAEVGESPLAIEAELAAIVDGNRSRLSTDERGDAIRSAVDALGVIADGDSAVCLDERLVALSR